VVTAFAACAEAAHRAWQSHSPDGELGQSPRLEIDRIGPPPSDFRSHLDISGLALVDPAAEDHRDLVWLADGAIGIEQTFAKVIERGAALEDKIVRSTRPGRRIGDVGSRIARALWT
jgi:hypothetical protein